MLRLFALITSRSGEVPKFVVGECSSTRASASEVKVRVDTACTLESPDELTVVETAETGRILTISISSRMAALSVLILNV